MKTLRFLSILTLVFTMNTASAQKVKSFKAWVTLTDNTRSKGILFLADSDSLVIMGQDLNKINIDPRMIKTIQIRRKGSVGKGLWIGALSGAVLGAVGGAAGGDDEPGFFSMTAEEKALGGAIITSFPAAGLGALLGSARVTYAIEGNLAGYLNVLPKLEGYALHKKAERLNASNF
ncbi:hypothetical protein [Robiginitalea sp. SC105]|uniref:hypothetical protein n=1 Tax=Robiginitalea sp. SC105 TaxID=2762332 RepID=UPI0016399540|nr:hypothetical protein [Robiginitalea sp. SC105]MBC2838839.1 hypothetical protein [Robiginitalea sp. SC105]